VSGRQLRDLGYDQWIEHVFAHAVPLYEPAWNFGDDADWWDPPPAVAAPKGIGLPMAAQWQGSLIWWGFDPQGPVGKFVEQSLKRFVAVIDRRAPSA